ncbi:MAG: hypothetical protein Q4G50_02005 [Corynebacterium sp.]|uniref:hypothetical protein n=1 Tax=Corynebacterium sp. TaxID=1720 RepID=UPI0026DEB7E0|nr:hypothetical protein [Corynebacterium sp.]MDO5668756.1 hypothetical protein [Corynebacterium sp.]
MQKIAAELRHRELTQEIYNIGDEVAEYIEHLLQSIRDWDGELTVDCLAEFDEILADARRDSRHIIGELLGLRQALTSGLRSGVLSAAATRSSQLVEPELLDAASLEELFDNSELDSRTALVVEHLGEIVEWVLAQTDMVAHNLDAVSLPHLYARVGTHVTIAVEGWLITVAQAFPGYTRSMRGDNPPEFLVERARIDAVVARVAAKRARRGAAS